MGRPTKLTPKVREAICEALAIGATREMAARYARVAISTFGVWMRTATEERERIHQGGEPDPTKARYLSFIAAIEDAEVSAGIGWLQVVDKAASREPDWAWRMLKQRFPEGFQDIERREMTGPGGGPIRQEATVKHEFSDDAAANILSILAEAGAIRSEDEGGGSPQTE